MVKFRYTADLAGNRTQNPFQAPLSTSREASVDLVELSVYDGQRLVLIARWRKTMLYMCLYKLKTRV